MLAPAEFITVETSSLRLSAAVTVPDAASRGLIVALHGGTYDSDYYRAGPDALFTLGPQLGYTVIALDRPGYGATAEQGIAYASFETQSQVLAEAIAGVAREYAAGRAPVVLGHSIGGMLALSTCALSTAPIAGVEVSGLGEHWQPDVREMWSSMLSNESAVTLPDAAHTEVMLGPAGTHDAGAADVNTRLLRPLPMPELADVVHWSSLLPEVGKGIRVPVSVTVAEYDHIWRSDDSALAGLADYFTAAPSFSVNTFPDAGHSIELHTNARAYVLRQLAFAEVCFVAHSKTRSGL